MKIKSITIFSVFLLLYSFATTATACPPPDCDDCEYWNGDCIPYGDCWSGCPSCESCVNCYCTCNSECGCGGNTCSGCCECSGCSCVSDDSNCEQDDCQMCNDCGCVTDPDAVTAITDGDDLENCIDNENSHPVGAPGWTPQPNGCSMPYILSELTGLDPNNPTGCEDTSFLDECNAHDTKYQTCSSDKGIADDVFGDAIMEVCMGSSCAYPCSSLYATAYYNAVKDYGDSAYEDRQVDACSCCD